MRFYQKLAGIGFALSAIVSYMFVVLVPSLPWEQQKSMVIGACFSVSGGYVFCLPALLFDVLSRQRLWTDDRKRFFGVPLFGASVGLLVLSWSAILSPTDLIEWNALKPSVLDPVFLNIVPHASELYSRAELLATCKLIGDNCCQFAATFAALAMISAGLYDTVKPRWPSTMFVLGFLVPSLPAIAEVLEHGDRIDFSVFWVRWLVIGTLSGTALCGLVWAARETWWSNDF